MKTKELVLRMSDVVSVYSILSKDEHKTARVQQCVNSIVTVTSQSILPFISPCTSGTPHLKPELLLNVLKILVVAFLVSFLVEPEP